MQPSRLSAFLLLASANLFWSGNWIAGRALRDAFDPVSLNFWRWVVATVALAPFALPALRGKWPLIRRHAGLPECERICTRRDDDVVVKHFMSHANFPFLKSLSDDFSVHAEAEYAHRRMPA